MNNLDTASAEILLKELDAAGWIFPEFEFNTDNGNLKMLGKGGFSVVYEMINKNRDDLNYALKVIGFERHVVSSERFWDTVRLQAYLAEQSNNIARIIDAREISVLLSDSGDIVDICDASGERWDEAGLHLQFVLMEKLSDIIIKDRFKHANIVKNGLMTESGVVDFAKHVGNALKVSHDNNVLHRDIKLENIFWNENDNCYVLGDFGIAKFVEEGNAETVVYTDGYGAPEIERRLGDYYNATADIYSFGITLYLLLNNLRFPGSDGYFVNPVQYDPAFVFPAAANASDRMNRIIRKMCRFYPEDRYQTIDEVLFDLSNLDEDAFNEENEIYEDLDFETETYKDDRDSNVVEHDFENGRGYRKKRMQEIEKDYSASNVFYMIGFVLFLTLMQRGLNNDTTMVTRWEFWLFPIVVLVEAVLLRIKEFHIAFGAIALIVGGFSIFSVGLTVQHCLLIFALLSGVPTFVAASAISVGCWMYLSITGKMAWTGFVYRYDLGWIFIVFSLFMLYCLMGERINANKISMKRAYAGVYIFDKIYVLVVLIGIVLLAASRLWGISIPESITRVHLIRTGIISFALLVIKMWMDGTFDDDNETIGENVGDDEHMDN